MKPASNSSSKRQLPAESTSISKGNLTENSFEERKNKINLPAPNLNKSDYSDFPNPKKMTVRGLVFSVSTSLKCYMNDVSSLPKYDTIKRSEANREFVDQAQTEKPTQQAEHVQDAATVEVRCGDYNNESYVLGYGVADPIDVAEDEDILSEVCTIGQPEGGRAIDRFVVTDADADDDILKPKEKDPFPDIDDDPFPG